MLSEQRDCIAQRWCCLMHEPALKMWWNDNTAKVLDLCWGKQSRLWTCFSVAVCPPSLVTWRCHLLSLSLHSKVTRRWSNHLLLVLSLCSGSFFCSLMLMWRDLWPCVSPEEYASTQIPSFGSANYSVSLCKSSEQRSMLLQSSRVGILFRGTYMPHMWSLTVSRKQNPYRHSGSRALYRQSAFDPQKSYEAFWTDLDHKISSHPFIAFELSEYNEELTEWCSEHSGLPLEKSPTS
jgi:hypothetical protein